MKTTKLIAQKSKPIPEKKKKKKKKKTEHLIADLCYDIEKNFLRSFVRENIRARNSVLNT